PQTLHSDGDPLDILVIVNEPTFSGCVIQARPLGVYHLVDKGKPDEKILAVPEGDPLYKDYHTLSDVPSHFLDEMAHFFTVYKDLERAQVEGLGWEGTNEAYAEIERAVRRYQESIGGLQGE
ncbi:MAG: inorganic diphosphatase, partial [Anaerolineales bacterium]|nr:inorganic diphosphatase [Anaerolineales bacterium]